MERILPIDDYRNSADPSQVHPGADRTCQDIKTTGCSLTTECVWLIFAASRQAEEEVFLSVLKPDVISRRSEQRRCDASHVMSSESCLKFMSFFAVVVTVFIRRVFQRPIYNGRPLFVTVTRRSREPTPVGTRCSAMPLAHYCRSTEDDPHLGRGWLP